MTNSSPIALAVDIGGTNTKIGFIERQRGLLAHQHFLTQAHLPFADFAGRLQMAIQELKQQAQLERFEGAGVGAPNVSFSTGDMVGPPNFSWGTFNLGQELAAVLNCQVRVDNDANLFALGEWRFGRGQGLANFILVTLGTGVGTGIVAGGQLLRGHTGLAAEGGHVVVIPQGRICGCGGQGHLEAYLGTMGLQKSTLEMLGKELNPRALAAALAQADPGALQVIDYSAEILARALAHWVTLVGPQIIILAGGLSHLGPPFFERIQFHLDQLVFSNLQGTCQVVRGELSADHGALLGAGSLALEPRSLIGE